MSQSLWKVTGNVIGFGDFEDETFVGIAGIDGDIGQIETCQVDTSDRRAQLTQYVSGCTRGQAIHRAARAFQPIVVGINLAGEFVYVKIQEPESVPDKEADTALTVPCPDDENEGTYDVFLARRPMQKGSSMPLVEEIEDWVHLYTTASERNRKRLENIVMGFRVFQYDEEMAFLYGYKVIENFLDHEFSDISDKSTYSRGRVESHLLRDLNTAFDNVDDAAVKQALRTLEQYTSELDDFPRAEMLHEICQRTGFYEQKQEPSDTYKAVRLRTKTGFVVPTAPWVAMNAYEGDEEARQQLAEMSFDVEEILAEMEEIVDEVEEEAREHADETLETWKNLVDDATDYRHRVTHELSEPTRRNINIVKLLNLAKYLTEKSINDDL